MKIAKETVKKITEYKYSINSSTDLEYDFFDLTKHLWKDIPNNDVMVTANLKDFSVVQEFLLKSVIKMHNEEKSKSSDKLDNVLNLNSLKGQLNGNYSYNDIYYLDNEECDYYFIGDIHSDSFIIEYILNSINFFENIRSKKSFKVILLGDYVDRGKNHFRTVEYLLLLKFLFPENIYLLMGNHDIGKIEDNEVTLYLRKAEEEKDYFYYYLRDINNSNKSFNSKLVSLYQEFMNNLNVVAFVMNKDISIMGVHGGIARPTLESESDDYFKYITSHKQLTDESIDYSEIRIRDNIIWSDPSIQHLQPILQNRRFKFFREHFESYKEKFGFDVMIRGHQAVEDGVRSYFDDSLYTVFSTGVILEDKENINHDTVYDFVTPKVMKYDYKEGLPLKIIGIK